jgi:hypothetical protein
MTIARRILAVAAIAFGLATIVAGGRVLMGSDPGYVVYRPLLVFNTAMGFAYVAVGVLMWRRPERGARAALAIFVVNLVVFVAIGVLYASGGPVAVDSVRAMTLRAGVWLALWLGLAWPTFRDA